MAVSRRTITESLTKAAAMHMVRYGFAVHQEIGLTRGGTLRADLLCLNFKKKLVVLEVKSSYADVTTDYKWPKMLGLCDQLIFVMPQKLWDSGKVAVGRGAGVLVLDEKTGFLRSVQRAVTQELLDDDTRDYLILRMAYRSAEFSKRNMKRRTRVYISEA